MINILCIGSYPTQKLTNAFHEKNSEVNIYEIGTRKTLSSYKTWLENDIPTIKTSKIDLVIFDCWNDVVMGNYIYGEALLPNNASSKEILVKENVNRQLLKISDSSFDRYIKEIDNFINELKLQFPNAKLISNIFSGSDYYLQGSTVKSLNRIDIIKYNHFMFDLSCFISNKTDFTIDLFDQSFFIDPVNKIYRFNQLDSRYIEQASSQLEKIVITTKKRRNYWFKKN